MSKQTIHKYVVPPNNQGVVMYNHAEVLSVGSQGDDVVIWVKENPDNVQVVRNIMGVMTGDMVDPTHKHHGAVQLPNGIVVHVFER